jgi:hypothetical protein
MIVVANAGPLIALAQIGQFELLQKLYGQIRIPVAVQREVVASGGGRAGTEDVATSDWVSVVLVQDHAVVRLLRERLDAGESEAVALALELQADLLLIDEARGRRVAETQGLNKTGVIGTLVAAKESGLVPAVTPLLDGLRARGFHMDERLYDTARQLAGEI